MKKETQYFIALAIILLLGAGVIFYLNELAFLAYLAVIVLIIFPIYLYSKNILKKNDEYIKQITNRIKDSSDKGQNQFPVGIIILDDKKKVEWANNFVYDTMNLSQLIGATIFEVIEDIDKVFSNSNYYEYFELDNSYYKVIYQEDSGYLYFFDVSENKILNQLVVDTKPAIMSINIDNQEEIYDSLNDEMALKLDAQLNTILLEWAKKNNIYLKKNDEDRFVGMLNHKDLTKLEKDKFNILDEIRNLKNFYESQVTISIGIGQGTYDLSELGSLAKQSLDLALGRGGDQVAIKDLNGDIRFYGGKTDPQEKRTRVKARVISNALAEIIKDSDKVLVMGHINPDFDAIGACMGIYEFAKLNRKDAYIILNEEDKDETIDRILEKISKYPYLANLFIDSKKAEELIEEKTCLIVVDTSSPSRVIDRNLLEKIDRKVIIDHHRRSEDIIEHALLTYIEPYASSASELITEMIEYDARGRKIDNVVASIILGGIVVDSQNFVIKTGSRTFDAAAYLRSQGADPILVKTILKEPLENYVSRAEIIKGATRITDNIVVSLAPEENKYTSVMLAKSADALLSTKGVEASFIIGHLEDGRVGISARSLGEVNVQIIMEEIGGGGHLTNAACQLEEKSLELVREKLIKTILEKTM